MGKTSTNGSTTPRGDEKSLPLVERLWVVPVCSDDNHAGLFLNDLIEKAQNKQQCHGALTDLFSAHENLEPFIKGICCNSAYLRDLAVADPQRLFDILTSAPKARIEGLISQAADLKAEDEAGLMRSLRLMKQDLALTLGLADISGAIGLDLVTRGLAAFADAALNASVRFCLTDLANRNRFAPVDAEKPEVNSGLILLAMGKHGAKELNYSSDIDLIILFDPAVTPMTGSGEAPVEFVRLTRRLIKIMQERTAEGYVFRTDLRLRPDPGATPLAMSVPGALSYYESLGQNWERAALIKARPCAGDIPAGEAFLAEITPFIWRKYLDFAAIADVQSIKRQIHMHKGHGVIAVAGHNVKLGRGGIREVEFFVQTQQLIAGGRNPELRGRRTLDMLEKLLEAGWIKQDVCEDLRVAYIFLRSVEHRIQMLNDEQTQLLPKDEEGLLRIAHLMGFTNLADFEKALLVHLGLVQKHYAGLFEDEPELASELGNLVFTGEDNDPDTLETLSGLGFKQPVEAANLIKAWHFGRYPATRASKSRERLTELHPILIKALAATDNADAALRSFDAFLSKLPAGVQLFALLKSNPELLSLLATVMGAAPRLAETVSRRIHTLDTVLDPAFFGAMPSVEEFQEGWDRALALATYYEDALDRARIFVQEQQFLIGLRLLSDTLAADLVGQALARLAEVVVAGLLDRVVEHVADTHGIVPGGELAVLAMGKLGSREMTAASDLDLILLYEAPEDADKSDGQRPLSITQYYTRLTQRFVTALSAPTAEGRLYEVDFRLRPSGNAGPLATNLSSFVEYQAKDAWNWEHMALTRARVIASSSPEFRQKIRDHMCVTLSKPRVTADLANDVRSMRARIQKEKGTKDIWDFKQIAGGLVDIEFIAQYLLLANASKDPTILDQNTEQALINLRDAGYLESGSADDLLTALALYHKLTQILRMTVPGRFHADDAPRGVLDLLVRASGEPDLIRLVSRLSETQVRVRELFEEIVGKVETVEASEKRQA
ncbi:MAG: bifunctional [glutamine synthetase] adenylyltransferase/[glutamine synthetase]-adenylyl-L-tyrosine phosphorylase [Rhodobacteraceae bacterium]|nr:bifunctional [glutamine synthetase] adenylyltransferase/[glutamine synthetase]-adenylyl-L-tyrosine phosphorylase [Paracoccaceae bacterium]